MTDATSAEVERLGKLLFGRSLRLRVALWVLARLDSEPSAFFQMEAATGIGYPASGVTEELGRLIELGMLMRVDADPSQRRTYYMPLDSPLWTVIKAARYALDEVKPSTDSGGARRAEVAIVQ